MASLLQLQLGGLLELLEPEAPTLRGHCMFVRHYFRLIDLMNKRIVLSADHVCLYV